MEYSKIIAITGLPGLYEMMNSKGDGAIVRSLDDQSTRFVSGRVHQFTHLESIEVYTERENVNLADVLNAMKDSSEKVPDEKDNKALEGYFRKVYPTLDFDRVYASDMKKMVKWYNALAKNDIEIKLSEPEPEQEEETAPAEETEAESANVTKPAKSKAKASEEAPAKETKAKPKKEEKEEEPVKAKATKAKETKAKDAKPAKAAKEKEEAPAKKASKATPAKKAAAKKKK